MPEQRKSFVADGYGVDRRDVMYNDYIILGPKNDPAKIKETQSAVDALKRIAETKSLFISRGDDSGTDKKEKSVWKAAGIVPQTPWYIEEAKAWARVADRPMKSLYNCGQRHFYLVRETPRRLRIAASGIQPNAGKPFLNAIPGSRASVSVRGI